MLDEFCAHRECSHWRISRTEVQFVSCEHAIIVSQQSAVVLKNAHYQLAMQSAVRLSTLIVLMVTDRISLMWPVVTGQRNRFGLAVCLLYTTTRKRAPA